MKIKLFQPDLSAGIQTASRVVPAKAAFPAVTSLFFRAKGKSLEIQGTDLDLSVRIFLPADVIEEGEALLPAKYLGELVRRLPATEITLEANFAENFASTISYPAGSLSLLGSPPEDFPAHIYPTELHFFENDAGTFQEGLRQVVLCVASSDPRPALGGVLLEIDTGGKITLVGTDLHRLAYASLNCVPEGELVPQRALLPARAAVEFGRIFKGKDTFQLGLSESSVLFLSREVSLSSRLISASFPDWQQVIPKSFKTYVKVAKEDFTQACERAAVLAGEDSSQRSCAVRFRIRDASFTVFSQVAGVGEIKEEIPAETCGEELEIAFNPHYLLDILRCCRVSDVYLKFGDALTPVMICPEPAPQELDYFHLVLPVRLR